VVLHQTADLSRLAVGLAVGAVERPLLPLGQVPSTNYKYRFSKFSKIFLLTRLSRPVFGLTDADGTAKLWRMSTAKLSVFSASYAMVFGLA
jgi:hypothetical protein